jgi:hypothetical protein
MYLFVCLFEYDIWNKKTYPPCKLNGRSLTNLFLLIKSQALVARTCLPFSNFLFTNWFSINFLYYFIVWCFIHCIVSGDNNVFVCLFVWIWYFKMSHKHTTYNIIKVRTCIYIRVETWKLSLTWDCMHISYNLMLNSGKQNNILTLVVVRNKISERNKKTYPPCKLNGRSLTNLFLLIKSQALVATTLLKYVHVSI